jgi:hypothetical protein
MEKQERHVEKNPFNRVNKRKGKIATSMPYMRRFTLLQRQPRVAT